MSNFVEHCGAVKACLAGYPQSGTDDRNIAAAQAWAMLALAEAVRDVADAVRGKDREE